MHTTQVEPDSFSYGSTVVAAIQTGRIYDGGSNNICWATSKDDGNTWTNGCLSGITKSVNGPYDRVSDPSVTYCAKSDVWLITGLAFMSDNSASAISVSRSLDGGLTWIQAKFAANKSPTYDKDWVVCDNTAISPFFGNCYITWDDYSEGNLDKMVTSRDCGATWDAIIGPPNTHNLGGQPLVQPNGHVIVPTCDASCYKIISFMSTNGGRTWGNTTTIATIQFHDVEGLMRTDPLPSAEIDGAGVVYVAWSDCRFKSGCTSNDVVYSKSADGLHWSSPVRIPLSTQTSTMDVFTPGLAVNKATSGSDAQLALTYYYFKDNTCRPATGTTRCISDTSANNCKLYVGFISSKDAGVTWSAQKTLTGPMSPFWFPCTSQGYMVGDYISTSFVSSGKAVPIFSMAVAPVGSKLNARLATVIGGISVF